MRRSQPIRLLLQVAMFTSLCACHAAHEAPDDRWTPVSGNGRLLSIDEAMGTGMLDIKGHTFGFWWNNTLERPGTENSPDARVSKIPFKANVGDTIYFRGFQHGEEIFVTIAAAVKR